MVIEATNETLPKIIEENTHVILDFWAPWCSPCKILMPMFEGLSDEVTGVVFAKVNVDDEPGLTEPYGVMSVPTLVAVKNVEPIEVARGLPQATELLNKVREGVIS